MEYTPFRRPYVCFRYNHLKMFIVCYPFSSFKPGKDNFQDPKYSFVTDGIKVRGKIVINDYIIVPKECIKVIDTSKHSIKNAKKSRIQDWLKTVLSEKEYCKKNFATIMSNINHYRILNKQAPIRHKIVNVKLIKEFNKKYLNIK